VGASKILEILVQVQNKYITKPGGGVLARRGIDLRWPRAANRRIDAAKTTRRSMLEGLKLKYLLLAPVELNFIYACRPRKQRDHKPPLKTVFFFQ
jgi:hypothetical protein